MKTKIKISLRKVRLNNGGYTDEGQYFGIGIPLYEYTYELNDIAKIHHIRAYTREHAKEAIKGLLNLTFPNRLDIRFYR